MANPELLTPRSSRVKAARRLTRRASRASEGLFLAEGPQVVREALQLEGCVVELFGTIDATERHRDLAEVGDAAAVPWRLVDDAALASLSNTVTPQGLVAVCRPVHEPLSALAGRRPALVAVGANVRDPGNAGTLVRCADAAGADAVVFAGESVDPYNAKAVRASVGSLFHLPVVIGVSVAEAVEGLHDAGLVVLAADGGGEDLDDLIDAGELSTPTAWLFGNEAWGLRADDAALADRTVGVPIHGRAESLNLATAAAVCLYVSARALRRS